MPNTSSWRVPSCGAKLRLLTLLVYWSITIVGRFYIRHVSAFYSAFPRKELMGHRACRGTFRWPERGRHCFLPICSIQPVSMLPYYTSSTSYLLFCLFIYRYNIPLPSILRLTSDIHMRIVYTAWKLDMNGVGGE